MAAAEQQIRQGGGHLPDDVGTPNRDGPGNAAYQRMQQVLAKVHAEEDARRRRN